MELIVRNEAALRKAAEALYRRALGEVRQGFEKVLVLRDKKRTDAQNRLLHALLGEVSKRVEWAGAKRSTVIWKRLMVAAWLRAEGESPDVLPALDGKGIEVLYEKTSEMSVSQLNSLIAYVDAWMAEHCPVTEVIDADTGEIIRAPLLRDKEQVHA